MIQNLFTMCAIVKDFKSSPRSLVFICVKFNMPSNLVRSIASENFGESQMSLGPLLLKKSHTPLLLHRDLIDGTRNYQREKENGRDYWLNHAMKNVSLQVWFANWSSYQNYRFPVKLLLGSQLCVWLQVRAIPAWGEMWEREGKSQRLGISSHKSHNPISLWSRLIQWMDGTEQGPVIHCTHFLCQYVPLTPTHRYHEDISLSPPVLMVVIQGTPTWISGLDTFKHRRALKHLI